MKRFLVPVLAYAVPTFVLGFVWHLVLFERYYADLAIYRADIIIPFGLLSMLIQAVVFAVAYERIFATWRASLVAKGFAYAVCGAVLSWSYTTLAVAAKNVMSSVPDYLAIETAFTIVQWALVAPLTVMAFTRSTRAQPMQETRAA
jgi:hypothetical protein